MAAELFVIFRPGPTVLRRAGILFLAFILAATARAVQVELPNSASRRLHYAATQLREKWPASAGDVRVRLEHTEAKAGATPLPPEGFRLQADGANQVRITAGDDSGLLYGALNLLGRVQEAGALPTGLDVQDAPALRLRGTAIGMQKTYILPGRKVYEYPYTPELFPFFYDRAFWTEYLDRMVELRLNTLYLWNGHPFASLVRLAKYPYALEVSEDVFARNVEMFRFITEEADKRGIWLVQMFYNILLSQPFAEHHGLPTQLDRIEPVAAEYTRESIAEFVHQYPNVGLLVCLGEALQDVPQQTRWCTEVILAGVKEGMARAGLTEQPPVVIRAHATDESVVLPAALQVYGNLYTMAKYNGESLTTWEPRGVWQQRHRAMSELGSTHVINVHILANLEPFRYGAPRFIHRSVQAMQSRLGAGGLHLYPLAYWNWPYSPDVVDPVEPEEREGHADDLSQLDRDWIWFEAWARYAWNPDAEPEADRAYWIDRLTDRFGDAAAAAHILDAYNDSGESAPRLLRRFGITEGNRQTLSLGMTLTQLVDPATARPYPELWLSHAPPGERLDEYVAKEWRGEPHVGETPPQVVEEARQFAARAVQAIESAAPFVTREREEFERLRNDVHCIRAMTEHYAEKVTAAQWVLRHRLSGEAADLERAEQHLAASVGHFRELTRRTENTYAFANSMQTGHRRVPVPGAVNGRPANYHWRDVLPVYEAELAEFRAQRLGAPATTTRAKFSEVPFRLVGGGAETVRLKDGVSLLPTAGIQVTRLDPRLEGLTAIRRTVNGESDHGEVEVELSAPGRVLIGYLRADRPGWRRPPDLDTDSLAAAQGAAEPVLRDGLALADLGAVDVYELLLPAGRRRIAPRGQGQFLILGVVARAPASGVANP